MKICPICKFTLRDLADECFNCGCKFDGELSKNIRDNNAHGEDNIGSVQSNIVVRKQDMMRCPNPDCNLLINIYASSCICGYKSMTDETSQPSANRSESPKQAEFAAQVGVPGVIWGYIGLLLACIGIFFINAYAGRHYMLRPNVATYIVKDYLIPRFLLLGAVVVGVMNYYLIRHRSKICRAMLILVTFPIGLILLDSSVSKYTSHTNKSGTG